MVSKAISTSRPMATSSASTTRIRNERPARTSWLPSRHLPNCARLDVGAWKGEPWRGERIATIEEVLATVPRGKLIFIELKVGPEIVEPLAKVLEMATVRPEQVVIISFQKETIAACEERMPHLKTQWLTGYKCEEENGIGRWAPNAEEVAATIREIGADGLGSQAELCHVNNAFLTRLRGAGIAEFGVWTVDDLPTARCYKKLGVTAITTNRPGWLRAQLEAAERCATPSLSQSDDELPPSSTTK